MPFAEPIGTVAELRRLYREQHKLVVRKQIDHIDAAVRSFIAASPFDASPRSGPPGFVALLDDHRLAFGERRQQHVIRDRRSRCPEAVGQTAALEVNQQLPAQLLR